MSERALSENRIYAARPTIRIDGRAHALTARQLLSMRLRECEGGMSALELRYSNWINRPGGGGHYAFEDEQLLRLGAQLSVYAGDEQLPREIFRGAITAVEAEFSMGSPPELVVLAEDKLQRSRMKRKTALHADVTIEQLATSVARSAELRAVVTGFSSSIGTQLQLNESDLSFLRRLLRQYDGDLQVVGDALHVSARADVQRDVLPLRFLGQLSWARVTVDLADQVSAVSVTGWDSERGSRVQHSSSGSSLGPGSGRTGARMLTDTLGERREHVAHVAIRNEREARALADSAFNQRARSFLKLEATADGNASIRVGTHVQIQNLSARFNNTYYVTQACHRYDVQVGEVAGGYHTDFEAECAYLGAPA